MSRGFVWADNEERLFDDARQVIIQAIESASIEERTDRGYMKTIVHSTLKRYLKKQTGRRPMIIPVILES